MQNKCKRSSSVPGLAADERNLHLVHYYSKETEYMSFEPIFGLAVSHGARGDGTDEISVGCRTFWRCVFFLLAFQPCCKTSRTHTILTTTNDKPEHPTMATTTATATATVTTAARHVTIGDIVAHKSIDDLKYVFTETRLDDVSTMLSQVSGCYH